MQALLRWARPRRWSILAEAALAVLVALAALPFLVVGAREAEEVAVVTAYLEALRDGDVERAETFVSDEYALDANLSWLTPEALSTDWEIESVALKSASTSTVHAVITSGEARAEGAFRLQTFADRPLIVNPYLYLTNVRPMFADLEINGVRGEVATADHTALPVALYPGSYRLFASAADLLGEGGVPLLALPGTGSSGYGGDMLGIDTVMTEPLLGGEAVESLLNEHLAAWIDACAASADPAPEGCPFSAASDLGGVADDGRERFDAVETLAWTVANYPEVRFDRGLRLEVVEPGWMTLSGNGTLYFDDGETAALDGRCEIRVDGLEPGLGPDGTFTFALPELFNTCG